MKIQPGTLAAGVSAAGFLSGPIFMGSLGLASLYLRLPQPIAIEGNAVAMAIAMLTPATLFGMFIGLPVNIAGGMFMGLMGRLFWPARSKLVWTLTGTAIGIAATWWIGFDDSPEGTFALVATCSICAWLCSNWVVWIDDEEPLPLDGAARARHAIGSLQE